MTDNKLLNQSDSIQKSIKGGSNAPSHSNSLKLVDNPSRVKHNPMTELANYGKKASLHNDSQINNSNLNESNIEKRNLLGSRIEDKSN